MLILSRMKDESIIIGDNIRVVVVEIRRDKVRLGVEAPREVPVHRREVFDAIHRGEKRESASSQPSSTQSSSPPPLPTFDEGKWLE